MGPPRSISTSADGTFDFPNLPAGSYSITAGRNTYAPYTHGQTRPFDMPKPVVLADRQTADVQIRMIRGGVIAGRIVDEFGEGIAEATVSPMRSQFSQGRRRLVPVGRPTATNDAGEFRLFGLQPGEYILSASFRAGSEVSDDRSGYAPTYYPGTPDAAAAQLLTIAGGQTIADITLALAVTRTAVITVTAIDAEGRPMTMGGVSAMPRGSALGTPVGSVYGGALARDGSFRLTNVPPGEYVLRANSRAPGRVTAPEVSYATVTVAGADINGVVLAPVAPATLRGRVIAEDASALAQVKPQAVRVTAQPLNPDDQAFMPPPILMRPPGAGGLAFGPPGAGGLAFGPPGAGGLAFGPPGALRDDFSFEIGTGPGRMLLRSVIATPGWTLKSVTVRGIDVIDTGFDVKSGDLIDDIVVEVTNRGPQLSGTLVNARKEPVAGGVVLLFAQDSNLWTSPVNRFSVNARTDQTGRFTFQNVPAGDYFAAALEYADPANVLDPDRLEQLRPGAVALTLREGDVKTQDIRLNAP
jgi:hypothetical protein